MKRVARYKDITGDANMFKNFISRIYCSIPVLRELIKIRDDLYQLSQQIIKIESMRFLDFYVQNNPRYKDPLRLTGFSFQVCSQNGEDGMIHEIFNRIGVTSKTFVEIGVGDGIENNTVFLLSQGWKGFWVDGKASFVKKLSKKNMHNDMSLKYMVTFITKDNIQDILSSMKVPNEFDLLSIDIDLNTYYVWEAMNNYRPRVVVIEYNSAIPPDIDWKVQYKANHTWDLTINYGASLKAYELLGKRLGYNLVGCDITGNNAFFVRDDLVNNKFAEPFTSENHYEQARFELVCKRGHQASVLDKLF